VYAGSIADSGQAGYGALMSAGMGSLVAALYMTRKQDCRRLRRNLFVGLAAFGLALAAFSQSRIFGLSAAINVVAGFGMILYAASTNTLIQLTVKEEFRGRIMSLYTLMFIGTAPFGSFLLGTIAEHFGTPTATLASGLACAVGAVGLLPAARATRRDAAEAATAA
jgi:MFS family permease